jgi:hypothetical protein
MGKWKTRKMVFVLTMFLCFTNATFASDVAVAKDDEIAMDKPIPVVDIEIGDYKNEIMVDDTIDLTAKVLPINATEQTISYVSTNVGVLTVNSSGQVKGIKKGNAHVILKAGKYEKRIRIKVLGAKTTNILLNKENLILKTGKSFKLKTKVLPKTAPQKLSYKSHDKRVAKVSQKGIIKANRVGNTFVTIANGDMTTSISVIVNDASSSDIRNSESGKSTGSKKVDKSKIKKSDEDIIAQIRNSDGKIVANQDNYPVITKTILQALSDEKALFRVDARDYSLLINGANIINPTNELYTDIDFVNGSSGTKFVMNRGRNMPGKISLTLKDSVYANGKSYLYLYNKTQRT